MSPLAFLQQPAALAGGDLALPGRRPAAARTSPTTSALRKVAAGGAARGSTSSSWQVAFNGAEPVRAETLERFAAAFAPCGFRPRRLLPLLRPGRGDAVRHRRRPPGSRAAPCGARGAGAGTAARRRRAAADERRATWSAAAAAPRRPAAGDRRSGDAARAARRDGSARSGSPGRAWPRGYWNRPEETARDLRRPARRRAARPFLRTGDLGFLARRRAVRHRPRSRT